MIVSSAVVAASPSKISSSASPIFALPIMNPVAATVELNVAAPAADISSVSAVIAEPPSFPWKIISSSDAPVLRIRSPVSLTIYEFVPPWYKFKSCPAPSVSRPVALSPVTSSASASTSKETSPPDVMFEAPLSMLPNPAAIEPEPRTPTVVAAVVTRLGIAVISSSR